MKRETAYDSAVLVRLSSRNPSSARLRRSEQREGEGWQSDIAWLAVIVSPGTPSPVRDGPTLPLLGTATPVRVRRG